MIDNRGLLMVDSNNYNRGDSLIGDELLGD